MKYIIDTILFAKITMFHPEFIVGKRVNWYCLSGNPEAVPILEKNLDKLGKLCWAELSRNPNAIPILEKNLIK